MGGEEEEEEVEEEDIHIATITCDYNTITTHFSNSCYSIFNQLVSLY